jgi:hypothetical protein
MATQRWLGNAGPMTQVTTLTPGGTFASGDTVTVTCNGKSATYQTTVATFADICNGISTALQNAAQQYKEFSEFYSTNLGTTVTLTGQTTGYPFTVTVSTTSVSGTWVASSATACTGPNFWDNGANWSTGSAPASGDNVYFDSGNVPCLYNISQSAVTLASLNVYQSYTGQIGLPLYNSRGYREYRTQELTLSATTCNVGQQTGQGASLIRLNVGSVACTLNVYATGQAQQGVGPPLQWRGTSGSNFVNVNGGNMAIAYNPGDTATVATLRTGTLSAQGSQVTVFAGSGASFTTLDIDGGTVTTNSGATTITHNAGTLTIYGSGAITTLNVYDKCYFNTTGTCTTVNLYGTGVFDVTQDQQTKTITNFNAYSQRPQINDPYQVITSFAPVLYGATDWSALNIGETLTLTRSAP